MNYLRKCFDFLKSHPHLIVIFLGIFTRLPLLFASLFYDSDGWRQADTASIAHHFFINGFKLFYPQIFWGGNGPGYVETEFQLYPFIVSILYWLFGGEYYWLGKVVSLLFSVFAWWLFFRLARIVLKNERAAIWALLFLVFSPLYVRYSVAFMPEATVLLFYMAALLFFVRWMLSPSTKFLIISSIFTALAILVKPTSIHIGLIFALVAFSTLGVGVLKKWDVWLALVIAILPGVLWYLHARNLYLTYGNTFGLLSGGDSKFGNFRDWMDPHLYYHLPYLDLKWILGFGAILPFIAGMRIAVKKKDFRFIFWGVAVVGLYYMLVPRYSHQDWGIQYHVYMLPFAALAVGLGIEWILGKYIGLVSKGIMWVSSGVFLWMAVAVFVGMLLQSTNDLYECAGYVRRLVPDGDRIIVSTTSFAFENGIPNNYQEPQIFFYSQHYGWSLPADWLGIGKLEEYRMAGASYFVIYSKELLESHPDLIEYLNDNSLEIGPGIDQGCAIYRFSSPSE